MSAFPYRRFDSPWKPQHAMENRQFRLCKFGVLRKVVDTQGGIHRNNMGESSDSVRGRVLGMARVELGDIVQREPFVAARVAAAPLEWFGKNSHDQHRQIRDLFARCDHLCRAIGDDGLKSTIFEDLGDLPASGTGAPGFATGKSLALARNASPNLLKDITTRECV
jgi:hypothetical protein